MTLLVLLIAGVFIAGVLVGLGIAGFLGFRALRDDERQHMRGRK